MFSSARIYILLAIVLLSVNSLKVQKRLSRWVASSVGFGIILSSVCNADGSSFEGTFSDPKHPGGTRTISLVGEKVGGYQLANVNGGGGKGEPQSYVLPAVVIRDEEIIIDFSPKGGPKDFEGIFSGDDIKFLKDGNVWPRLKR